MMKLMPGDLVRIMHTRHPFAGIAVEPPDDYAPSVWGVFWGGELSLVHIDNLELISDPR